MPRTLAALPLASALAFALALALASTFGACTSVEDDVSGKFLRPETDSLVEPEALGLAAIPFEIETGSEATATGFLLPHPDAKGRTVVLFHGQRENASMAHPYWTFLHAAGLNVVAFDPRGYGRSKGEPSLRALFRDVPEVLDWVCDRPEVDADKLGFYGVGLGGTVALWAAAHTGRCRALVVESTPSLSAWIRADSEKDGTGAVAAGFREFASLPDHTEPAENAANVRAPALYLCGERAAVDDRGALLRAYLAHRGEKQLYVLPGAGAPPESLLTHDGEYQRAVATFLRSALDGGEDGEGIARVARVDVAWKAAGRAPGGGAWHDVTLTRRGDDGGEPWAVQVTALDEAGKATHQNVWLEGTEAKVRVRAGEPAGIVAAVRIADVAGTEDGGFARRKTKLTRSAEAIAPLEPRFAELRVAAPTVEQAMALAEALRAAERQEPFHERLEAQLAGVYARIGEVLADSSEPADRAEAIAWLRRAVAAAPKEPSRHTWPAAEPTWGWPHAHAVEQAQALLRRLEPTR